MTSSQHEHHHYHFHRKDKTDMNYRKSPTRLYKIPREGKLMGVCAGVADYTGVNLTAVRILWVVGLFTPINWILLIGYFVLGMTLDPKPEDLYEDVREEEFWRQARKAPDYTAADLRRRFRELDRRTGDMEAYMTSKSFKLDRELKALED
ncbi:envelope stress response membrane protein PspC [Gimibacter soli]|uniref:Envelope stress response membrane protein PspC n=1 Tax=Gimibacter soli TaxID=3024400 RepID=A0AAF0BLJ1_9PROT|nr:envelope stress response membrane protein PspC [Gimibacter soli]WCL54212.1 envelope stress response membrane protein PspC [Gimibacter soli]